MQNLKIGINAEQPLDEVVKELERLGYKNVNLGWESSPEIVFIDNESKLFCFTIDHDDVEPTTLTELRSMS